MKPVVESRTSIKGRLVRATDHNSKSVRVFLYRPLHGEISRGSYIDDAVRGKEICTFADH